MNVETASARVRAQLDHPVIDADGHWMEPVPIFLEFLRDAGGAEIVDRYQRWMYESWDRWYDIPHSARLAERRIRPAWLTDAPNGTDRATAMLPALLHERLDELGIDFAVVYTTIGLFTGGIAEPDLRRAFARAVNEMNAELFAPFADRMTPVAVLPAGTPDEAVEELVHARGTLGMKAALLAAPVRRPIEAHAPSGTAPGAVPSFVDALLDGPHDYDPLWAKAVELGVAITSHTGGSGWPDRTSPTSFVYNHIGHFAAGNHALAKGLFLGGVTRRFPTLNFAFLEGGAAWAAALYLDLLGHWRKRNKVAMERRVRSDVEDRARVRDLVQRYATGRMKGREAEIAEVPSVLHNFRAGFGAEAPTSGDPMGLDEFAALGGCDEDDLRSLFRDRFYFGCESDDPTAVLAFDERLDVGSPGTELEFAL